MSKHILLIDDVVEILRLMRMMLEEENHQVSVLESGQGALDYVKQNRPDLIVLDLKLGNMSGITVLRELKGDPETANIPVVVYTASLVAAEETQQLIAREPELYAGTRVLQKPFALDELLKIVA